MHSIVFSVTFKKIALFEVSYFSNFYIKVAKRLNFVYQFIFLFKSRNFLSLDLVGPFQIIVDKTKIQLKVQVEVVK